MNSEEKSRPSRSCQSSDVMTASEVTFDLSPHSQSVKRSIVRRNESSVSALGVKAIFGPSVLGKVMTIGGSARCIASPKTSRITWPDDASRSDQCFGVMPISNSEPAKS